MSGYRNSWRPMGKYRRCAARNGTRNGVVAIVAAVLTPAPAKPAPICTPRKCLKTDRSLSQRKAEYAIQALVCCSIEGMLVH